MVLILEDFQSDNHKISPFFLVTDRQGKAEVRVVMETLSLETLRLKLSKIIDTQCVGITINNTRKGHHYTQINLHIVNVMQLINNDLLN